MLSKLSRSHGACPVECHFIHIETSSDADSWATRETKFKRKFDLGREYIPQLMHGLNIPDKIEQHVVFLFCSTAREYCGGGRVYHIKQYVNKIKDVLKDKKIASAAVPEHYPLLRTIQIALVSV